MTQARFIGRCESCGHEMSSVDEYALIEAYGAHRTYAHRPAIVQVAFPSLWPESIFASLDQVADTDDTPMK